jgi:hypothetical protein
VGNVAVGGYSVNNRYRDRMKGWRAWVFHVVLMSACTVGPPPVPLPTSGRPLEAAGDATGGRIERQGGCVVLVDDGGVTSNLLWPPGYRVAGSPASIVAPDGKTIIREHDEVLLGVEDLGSRLVPGCSARHTWAIGEIAQVNGQTVGTPPPPLPKPPKPPG